MSEALERAAQESTTVLISGEAGIGKTRLVEGASHDSLRERGRVSRSVAASPCGDGGLPYAPIARHSRRWLPSSAKGGSTRCSELAAPVLDRIMPGLAGNRLHDR